MTTEEIWKEVVGWPGYYEVSNLGNVRSVDREITYTTGQVVKYRSQKLSPAPDKDGYLQVVLYRKRKGTTRKVHHLVLEAFVGERPTGQETRHLNDNRSDNRPENLAWGTSKQNSQDILRAGTHFQVRKSTCPVGHELREPNLCPWSKRNGRRKCRSCALERSSSTYYGVEFKPEKATKRYDKLMQEEEDCK